MKTLPVVVLSGLRQSGKSTLLQNESLLTEGHRYQTLDDFPTLAAARSNPESLLDSPTVIDEVQRCPELLVELKRKVDANRDLGRFLLSGSANLALLSHVTETLAGRAGYFALHPMTRREQKRSIAKEPFLVSFLKTGEVPKNPVDSISYREVLRGGLPPACLSPEEDVSEWFRAYVQTYVERDVRQLSQISDLVAFRNLTQLAALRTSQLLVISSLARDAKMNAVTASRYIDLLEASFLVRRLPPFLKNRSARLVKSPKLFLTDSGLASFLCGVHDIGPSQSEPLRGPLFETYIVQNLAALLECHLPNSQMSFWGEQGRHEVDVVLEVGRKVLAIEIKAATRWSDHDLAGLRAFQDRTPGALAVLAYNGELPVVLGDNMYALPLGLLLA